MLSFDVDALHTAREMSFADPSDQKLALTLRTHYNVDVYGWEQAGADGFESDKYESQAGHFGFFRGDELVAYIRFIPCLHGDLPIFGKFPGLASKFDQGTKKYGEVTRLVAIEEYRGREDLSASAWLYKLIHHWATPRGYRVWLMEIEQWMIDQFRGFGFVLHVLGESKLYPARKGRGDEYTFPVLLDLDETIPNMYRVNPGVMAWYDEGLEQEE